MTDIELEQCVDTKQKDFKTKDYVRRAVRNYERKRYAEDPEFRKKKIECSKEHKKNNIEKTREYNREYMRKYRKNKKKNKLNDEMHHKKDDSIENIISSIEPILRI